MPDDPEINQRGNTVIRTHVENGDRYLFDFNHCADDAGWTNFTTDQDAWYFGVWVHPERREIVTFAEDELVTVKCPSDPSFDAEIRQLISFYGVSAEFSTISADGTLTRYYQDRANLLLCSKKPCP